MPLLPAVLIPSGGTPADHLPLPRKPTHDPVEILYLSGREAYDGGSFLTYPSRRGWTEKDLYDPKNTGKSEREITSFFQTWLFWGLLTDVLRRPVHETDLVRENKYGQQVITTKSLPELMLQWFDREQFLSRRAQEKHAVRVDKNLWRLCNILSWWCVQGTIPFDQWTALYLNMLGEYLQAGYKVIYQKASGLHNQVKELDSLTRPIWFSPNRRWSSSCQTVIKEQMAANGWCRSDIQRLQSTLLTHGLFYASMLKPPGYENVSQENSNAYATGTASKHHLSASLNNKHQHCSEFSCSAYQWDKKEYKTKHVSEFCTCMFRKADGLDLVRILKEGQIPVVRLQDGIQILPALPGVRYVAISHVWSDGLGNPNANALPHCQLSRIARYIDNLYHPSEGTTAFWIDTLCCPVEPYSARAQAISLMSKTYKGADKVLVFDSYLMSQSFRMLSTMDTMMMIHCSKWNRRLWTLQEQLSARGRLHFQFGDVSMHLNNIVSREIDEMNPRTFLSQSVHRWIVIQALSYNTSAIAKAVWADHALFDTISGSSLLAMAAIQGMLPFRATTKASDEAICLGNLLNLDIQRILSVPEAARMETLWSIMPNIPPDVIFWIGPKLKKKGFRWAPSTFLNGRDLQSNVMINAGVTQLAQKGLRVQYPGWMLGCKRGVQVLGQFYIMDASGTLYRVSCFDSTSREYIAPDQTLDPWSFEPANTRQSTLHVISQFDLDDAGSAGPRICHDSLLVLAYGIDQETLLAHSVCPVTVRKLEADDEETQRWRKCAEGILDNVDPSVREMGIWCSSTKLQPNVIDLMGCSAISKDCPWWVD